MLKGMPWSRAKRKALFQSDGWVVHLCAGDGRSVEAREQQSMRRAMWSSSLTGGDVMVDVDIADSRHMDLLQQGAVFRVLAWGGDDWEDQGRGWWPFLNTASQRRWRM